MKFRRVMTFIVVCAMLAFIHLWITTKNVSLKYEVFKLKTEFKDIYTENQALSNILERKRALPQVQKVAEEKLGMVYPSKVNFLLISEEAK